MIALAQRSGVGPHAVAALGAACALGAAAVTVTGADGRLLVACGLLALGVFAALRARKAGSLAALAIASCAGMTSAWLHGLHAVSFQEERTARYAGTVLDVVSESGAETAIAFALDRAGTVAVTLKPPIPSIGSRLVVRGRLLPFDGPRNPGEPDLRSLEAERGLDGRLADARVLSVGPPRAGFDLRIAIARLRAWASARLRARMDPTYAALVAGELWGARGDLPPELRAEFQETGTVHVLVTAGLHLGAVAALVVWLLEFLTVPRLWSSLVAGLCLWTYAVLSGAHLPSLRAATMLSFGLLARACGAQALSWNALGAAAAVLALVEPRSVGGASFALSFSCVGAIILLAAPIAEALRRRVPRLPHRLAEAVALACATQAGTWPLGAALFLQIAPYAVLANAIVVPSVGLTMLFGALQLVADPIAPLAQIFARLDGWCAAWSVWNVHAIASLPEAHLIATPPPTWSLAAYGAALCAAVAAWSRGARTAACAFALIGVTVVLEPPRAFDGRLRVTMLDVGQAQGMVVVTPRGHAVLVDAGGTMERGPQRPGDSAAERAGERIVVAFLIRSGIHRLDAIVLTHPHGDHVGAAAPALRIFPVGALITNGATDGGTAYRDALSEARARGVPVIVPRAGRVLRFDDGTEFAFLGPPSPRIRGTPRDVDENSVVVALRYRAFRMLFTGDAGIAAERRLLRSSANLRADVLQVGHHGSAYASSAAFLQAVHPALVLISDGRQNRYGFPAPRVLRALTTIGACILRTDLDGAIMIATDGSHAWVRTQRADFPCRSQPNR
jgi:competence protein ComEC